MNEPLSNTGNILQNLTLNISGNPQCEQYIQQTSNETCKGSIFIIQNISIYLFFFKDTLTISGQMAIVGASTVWGLLRGLETFSQLLYIDEQNYVCSLDIYISLFYVVVAIYLDLHRL